MRRLACLALLAACASTSTDFIAGKQGYRVTRGYIIRLNDLHSPRITKLEDGVAYEVTRPGCTLTLELGRKRRREFELRPGDWFVSARPFSYVLQAPR